MNLNQQLVAINRLGVKLGTKLGNRTFKGAFCLGRSKILLLRPHFTHIVETDVPNVTQGKRSRHRVILQLLAVILHLFLSKTVYENYTKTNFENLGFVYKLSKMMKIVRNVEIFENLGSKISKC